VRRRLGPRIVEAVERSFEEMYAAAGDDLAALPWASLKPFPLLVEWLDDKGGGVGGKALVVGAGLGDDAEELARRGFDVTAFDLSATAIERARERFPDSTVDYRVADLLDLPAEWSERFDLVVEIRTLQSLPIGDRAVAAAAIAGTVAPGGLLWLLALGRDSHQPGESRPWPVTEEELAVLEAAGLKWESRREDLLDADLYEVRGTLRR
jgi:2-polyprenyl-3-methyl-5-hydroxy-6-metoxy-1,4-benzoquinol methylase